MESTKELMLARQQAHEQELLQAQENLAKKEQELAQYQEGTVEYNKADAERKMAIEAVSQAQAALDAQTAAGKEVLEEQVNSLDELYVSRMQKVQEMNNIVMEGMDGYIKALDSFAERAGTLVGEGAFGDPEKRKEAGRELLKDVIKVTSSVLTQWLTNLVVKKGIDAAELASAQATQSAITQIYAIEEAKRLGLETTEMEAQLVKTIAEGTGKTTQQLGVWGLVAAAAIGVVMTALTAAAIAKIDKAKSEAQSLSGGAGAGRLSTGMLTYAEGNVNEFTNPNSLKEGHSYAVDASDGRTYRARYTGRNPKTHITNGPEFHLAGERGREMIIDADTTREIVLNERGVYSAIKMLSNGSGDSRMRRRGAVRKGGVVGFAEGNVEDFADMGGGEWDAESGMSQMASIKDALDRNSAVQEALLERLRSPIQAKFDVYGPEGLIDSYDRGKKTVTRYGQKY